MADLNLDELERLANRATPGPWRAEDHDTRYVPLVRVDAEKGGRDVRIANVLGAEDARLIAAARDAIPELIGWLRGARRQLAARESQVRILDDVVAAFRDGRMLADAAAEERETCARIVEEIERRASEASSSAVSEAYRTLPLREAVAAIRARGAKP